ncbi:hypothetical protein CTAM01_01527 [Colletotrichum tamarilloi]|uniref:Uncharacterized protein n=1 Tax=Colletotrichum tamarilloi TaxID=1209934 RepID=A0ABQ9RRF6_9PEZI|nr:uncharacterized protein CTAM01_01527 [Colletotrichum tamarilloi]KAK1510954.1 hypothetical protein CTAM01_01527 [Colletotrichum tamarilloi]
MRRLLRVMALCSWKELFDSRREQSEVMVHHGHPTQVGLAGDYFPGNNRSPVDSRVV